MKKSFARKVLLSLLAVTAVLLLLHVVMQYINLEIYHEKQGQVFELSNRLDVDDEVSLPTWFSQFLLFAIGCSALLVAYMEKQKLHKRAWFVIGLFGVLLSIDEVASIHELVLQTAHLLYYGEVVPTAAVSAWWLLLPFIVIAGVLMLRWLYKVLPRWTWLLFFAGGTMSLIGAAGFEVIGNDFSKLSYIYQGTLAAIEEGFEMVGSIIVLYAVLKYIEDHHLEKIRGALKRLKSNEP